MAFPVFTHGCESWIIKKTEHWRIDTFELWCWKRLLRVPWTARRSNHSILKEINPKNWCWSWNVNTLATWSKESIHCKDPEAGKDWGQEEKGTTEEEMVGWHQWLKGHEFKQTLGDSEGQGSLVCCSPWHRKESYMTSDWTTTKAGTMTFNWRCLKSDSLGALPKVTQNMAAPKLIWTILSPIAFYLITMTLLIQCWMSAMTKVIPWFSERIEESPTMHPWRRFVC